MKNIFKKKEILKEVKLFELEEKLTKKYYEKLEEFVNTEMKTIKENENIKELIKETKQNIADEIEFNIYIRNQTNIEKAMEENDILKIYEILTGINQTINNYMEIDFLFNLRKRSKRKKNDK